MDVDVNDGSILNLDLGSWLIQWCLLVLSLLSGTASPSSTSGPLPGPCLLSPGTGPPSLSLLPPQLSPSHLGHLCSCYGSCPQSPVRTLADGNKFLLHLSLKPLPASLSQQKLIFPLDTVPATFSNRGFPSSIPSGLECGEAEECGCLHFPPNCAHLGILWPSQSFYSYLKNSY